MCCNFYLQGGCVAECPSALVADSNFDCGEYNSINLLLLGTSLSPMYAHTHKPAHTHAHARMHAHVHTHACTHTHTHTVCSLLCLENGDVTYSPTNRDVGSVATHTCNSGYLLSPQGGETRTCTSNGWDGQNVTCGENTLNNIKCN